MCFAKPVRASVSIQAFSERAKDNADGWGLAWYPDQSLAMVKQPDRWSAQHTQFLEHFPGLLSSIYLAHVRHKTTGPAPTHADTHPFARELNGREYCFAHNGTLTGDFWLRALGRFQPVGNTDSEFVFCLLLAELERFANLADEFAHAHAEGCFQCAAPKPEQQWKWLHRYLLRLNDYGRLNCILTDGESMLVYHDKNGWKGMSYRNIYLLEDSQHHFSDATVAVNLEASPVNHGIIVATNPLSVGGWEHFLPGEMKVLRKGAIAVTSRETWDEKPSRRPAGAEAAVVPNHAVKGILVPETVKST
jgi:glutamine amidotransferase